MALMFKKLLPVRCKKCGVLSELNWRFIFKHFRGFLFQYPFKFFCDHCGASFKIKYSKWYWIYHILFSTGGLLLIFTGHTLKLTNEARVSYLLVYMSVWMITAYFFILRIPMIVEIDQRLENKETP